MQWPQNMRIAAALLGCVLTAAAIGLLEDFRELNPVLKPGLLALAGIPIVAAGIYTPNPHIPFVGPARLTIVYPLLVLAGFAVLCNAVNSIDVLNGSMAYSSIPPLLALATVAYIEGRLQVLGVALVLAASLAVFLTQNKYPAKVFAGNVGSLFVGAAITYVAIVGRMEVVAIVAMMPQIMNEFHIIYSLRGLKSAKTASVRPVIVEGGVLRANLEKEAPLTLLRMFSVEGVSEKAAVNGMLVLSTYSSILSLVTYFLFIRGITL
jgi:UDP-N-acetylglucosamine--dolichyl-phosphate N-acetylglucosaminephosphotransferase